MLRRVATDLIAGGPTCAECGRRREPLFPREPVGPVCSTCYETLARRRPEWSALEIVGIAVLLLGSALLVIAVIALIVKA